MRRTSKEKMYRTNIPKSSGIYLILSKETDRKYVGSSIDLRKRKNEHFKALSEGTHGNSFLQNHTNKYGADDLKFGVIELCPKANLIEREQYYIDSIQLKFNLCPTASSRLGTTLTEEQKKKLSEAHKGQLSWMAGRKHTEESKQKMRGWILRNRIPMSEEQKKKISAALTGRKHTEEWKQKMRDRIPWNKGIPISEEQKKKLSAAMKGQVLWNKGIPMSEEQKKKLSAALKGRIPGMAGKKHSEKTKQKMSDIHRNGQCGCPRHASHK